MHYWNCPEASTTRLTCTCIRGHHVARDVVPGGELQSGAPKNAIGCSRDHRRARMSVSHRWADSGQTRGAVGTSTGTGYIKRYSYDRCVITNPPPYFPTTGRFQDNRYYELDPVRFNVDAPVPKRSSAADAHGTCGQRSTRNEEATEVELGPRRGAARNGTRGSELRMPRCGPP